MQPKTILVDETPRCVVRPNDTKALNRFIRNAKPYLVRGNDAAKVTHRDAEEAELLKYKDGVALHVAAGGNEDEYFGVPL